ncbi:MAG: Re/Si-specific NAD(P)(+) transhydrogenase subunit alpha [Actinomycetaceae bacterium]|nr:Re/Si-specific NAD(P)(+) transhydrogenase subunit alpha [Actinomycetaceae bacterium]
MLIGVPKEPQSTDVQLVAATPDTVGKLMKLGYDVCVESGAGDDASFMDDQYAAAGAQIVGREEVWKADLVVVLDTPPDDYLQKMNPQATLLCRMAPGRNEHTISTLAKHQLTGLAMDAVPRISRAQSMDVLSSMANLAGNRAIIEAAHSYGRLFTGQVTAAGKMPPANIYVIGAGVAGLAAIGTANSMGAQVRATDVRPEVAEQVESMGAEFVAIPVATQKSEDGYAKEMDEDQARAALKLYSEQAAQADIVVTTANIPGRTAPILITAEAVASMKPGSIIVDMAAANGGNCELTKPDEVVVTDNGVTILGYTDLARRLPGQASQLYAQNIVNLFKLLTPNKDGQAVFNMDDEIIRGITVTERGTIMWPPPPIKVSATPTAHTEKENAVAEAEAAGRAAREAAKKKRNTILWSAIAFVLMGVLVLFSPAAVLPHYMVLALAIVVGFYVITAVTHSLHTPLMSETNAISGIILVGALLQIGSSSVLVNVLSFIAVLVASINIFGGFTVTHRMLGMFKKED